MKDEAITVIKAGYPCNPIDGCFIRDADGCFENSTKCGKESVSVSGADMTDSSHPYCFDLKALHNELAEVTK